MTQSRVYETLDRDIWNWNLISAQSSLWSPKIHNFNNPSTKFPATPFCTLGDPGKKLSLVGGADHVGFMK